jgi:signal transduction histidine kinase
VLVEVSDSGPGLPPANLARIFEAFDTTKSNGSGMGLLICRSIVEAHGGRLWATANEPRGAVFCVMLPIGEQSLGTWCHRRPKNRRGVSDEASLVLPWR